MLAISLYGMLLAIFLDSALGQNATIALPLPTKTLVQLDTQGTVFENLLVRQNGDIIITSLHPQPIAYLLKAPWSSDPKLLFLHRFEEVDGLGGVVEIRPGTYVVAGTKWEGLAAPVANATVVQEFALDENDSVSSARIIARVPEAGFLNGVVVAPGSANLVLGADSLQGVVWRIDLTTGDSEISIDVAEMKPLDPHGVLRAGVNGLKVRNGHLYWSNSNLAGVYRIKTDDNGYPAMGAATEQVFRLCDASGVDDFNFDHEGNIYITTHIDNTLYRFGEDGSTQLVAGALTDLGLAGDSAVAFGRTSFDEHVAYITTAGGIFSPINGTITEPAKIVSVDTSGIAQ
ncbi:hypothetical protein B0I35DRAFT_479721 [Stachybotrys elegans]|uniref:SMP-30/Gluconolactonase/LRE-like region domain-containing protein n=1 Tax=Stachybotrys elegans TaxID=80388 RepID=A0A8K0WPX7_9HYPO|nr:hypothetical protein B0I35DRAFT_479721 [Stachybotrys elegans]